MPEPARIALLVTCLVDLFRPSIGFAAVKLLEQAGCTVEVPAQTCISRFVTPQEAARANDVMIIRFSSPFVNPFGRGQTGTLARLSLGNEAATWYWIPLVYRNDRWLAAPPLALSVLE